MIESTYTMLPVPSAQEIVLNQTETLQPVSIRLNDALGRILAGDVRAGEPLPPFPASVVDGYAVVAADGPGEYPVVAEIRAGHLPDRVLQPGEVAYITTGAPLPAGADAVIMVEDSTPLADGEQPRRVRLSRGVQPGDHVRPVGVDLAVGEEVLSAGTQLGAAEIGLLATVGAATVDVYPRPRVAVLSTGDELADLGETPGPGQIRDSNRAMLQAAVSAAGGEPMDLGIACDDADEIRGRIEHGLAHAEILLSTGGVSMGDSDLIKPLLERSGEVHFGRLHMKPGKPCTFATAMVDGRRRLIFGLPGNPVSGLVTFYLMVIPALRKLSGLRDPRLRRVQAFLIQALPLDDARPEYHRATLHWDMSLNNGQGGYWAASTGRQASSRLASMRTANALLELPQSEGELPAGTVVSALVIGSL